jgi:hypothetical protein
VVIFDKGEIYNLNSDNASYKPTDPKKAAFLESFKSISSNTIPYEAEFNLETPPLAWGKKVNDFRLGRLAYHTSFSGGFVADVWLNNLLPKHNYILCLNGRPDLDGNDLLTEPVPNNEKEKYYDFLIIQTDANGEYHSKVGVYLKTGAYHVRFYVKDNDDKLIILYHDYFKFSVK